MTGIWRIKSLYRLITVTAALLLAGSVAVVPAAAAAARPAVPHASSPAWLTEINYYRRAAGVPLVSANRSWIRGIRNHLRYMAKTPPRYLTGKYASLHTENPKSPYYTKSGAREAGASDLFEGAIGYTATDFINGWLAAPFHAIGMLRVNLRQVAFASNGSTGDAGLDVISGLTGTARAGQHDPAADLWRRGAQPAADLQVERPPSARPAPDRAAARGAGEAPDRYASRGERHGGVDGQRQPVHAGRAPLPQHGQDLRSDGPGHPARRPGGRPDSPAPADPRHVPRHHPAARAAGHYLVILSGLAQRPDQLILDVGVPLGTATGTRRDTHK